MLGTTRNPETLPLYGRPLVDQGKDSKIYGHIQYLFFKMKKFGFKHSDGFMCFGVVLGI